MTKTKLKRHVERLIQAIPFNAREDVADDIFAMMRHFGLPERLLVKRRRVGSGRPAGYYEVSHAQYTAWLTIDEIAEILNKKPQSIRMSLTRGNGQFRVGEDEDAIVIRRLSDADQASLAEHIDEHGEASRREGYDKWLGLNA